MIRFSRVRREGSERGAPVAVLAPYSVLVALAALVIGVDQVVKVIVSANLKDGHVVDVLGGLVRFDYTSNTGAAFGMFRAGGGVFAAIAIVVCAAILAYYRRIARSPLLVRLALGLILGGALGNLIDRIRLGYVIDFIDLRWWPVFNLADSAIVLGVCLLLIHTVRQPSVKRPT